MRLLLLLACLFISTSLSSAGDALKAVPFVAGPEKFMAGDRVVIEEVQSTSPDFKPGDRIVVKGSYQLKSREKANLSLFMTKMQGNGTEAVVPDQTMPVNRGKGTFKLAYEIREPGALHLTFYSVPEENIHPVPPQKPFGGVYFGTPPQMDKIKNWKLDDYEAEMKKKSSK